jgi:hypothetical protein
MFSFKTQNLPVLYENDQTNFMAFAAVAVTSLFFGGSNAVTGHFALKDRRHFQTYNLNL